MTDFPGARVRVGGSAGLAGGGVTSGELTTAITGLAPGNATYITQTANGTLTNEQALGSLATGILKSTTTTGVLSIATGSDLPSHSHAGVVTSANFLVDGGGTTITTGIKGDLFLPFGGTITRWIMMANQTGSISITVWKDSYANYPPTSDDSLLTMTISSHSRNGAVGLSHAVSASDILRFNVNSATSIQRVSIMLEIERTI